MHLSKLSCFLTNRLNAIACAKFLFFSFLLVLANFAFDTFFVRVWRLYIFLVVCHTSYACFLIRATTSSICHLCPHLSLFLSLPLSLSLSRTHILFCFSKSDGFYYSFSFAYFAGISQTHKYEHESMYQKWHDLLGLGWGWDGKGLLEKYCEWISSMYVFVL